MMERNVYDIYEMFAHLSLEQKKGVLRDFQEMVDAEESRPEGSYLEQKWKEIEDSLYDCMTSAWSLISMTSWGSM